jgi:superoxide dismutase, Fe-Mn family
VNDNGGFASYDDIFNETYPFSLDPLPYAADALEPAIDAKTMEIHHGRHHQAYLNNLNNGLEEYEELQEMTISELVAGLNELPNGIQNLVRNHGGGI